MEFINCNEHLRSCVNESGKDFFTDNTQSTFTTFGLEVVNSLDVELARIAGDHHILATAGGGGIALTPSTFRVADEVMVNLDQLPDDITPSNQLLTDIWGGGLRPSAYSLNGGFQAGQLRATHDGGSGSALIDTSGRRSALNNNGFLSYAVQVEEDIVNTAALAIRDTSSASFISGTLYSLVDNQIDLSNIRARDGLLAQQADARAGAVLQGSSGERVRVQQYVYRPPSNSDEVRMTSISLTSTDLSYMDLRVGFQAGDLSGKTALDIRNLEWADYFTLGYTNTDAGCEASSCSAAVISPGSGAPVLDTMSFEMGNGAGDYIREKLVLDSTITSAASLYKFDGSTLGSVTHQLVTTMELVTRKSGAGAKTFSMTGAPLVFKPHTGSTLGVGSIVASEFRVIPRTKLSGANGPPNGHPDGFYYVANDGSTTHEYPINFAVVGDATSSTNTGVRSINCGSSGSASCGAISFDNIWTAMAVNHPTSGQGQTPEIIGANALEITADPNGGELSKAIRTYLIPWPRMIWRGETGF